MRIDTRGDACPVGLLEICDLLDRMPGRKKEIVDHAIRVRERDLLVIREIRASLTVHPWQAARLALIAGAVTFVLALIVTEIAAFGHWYADLKSAQLDVPIPLVGNQSLHFGNLVPTSTALAVASYVPALSWMDAVYISIGIMAAIIVEKLVVSALHLSQSRMLGRSRDELQQELAALRSWSKG